MAKKVSFKFTTYKGYDISKLEKAIQNCLKNVIEEEKFDSIGNITVMFDLFSEGEKLKDEYVFTVKEQC